MKLDDIHGIFVTWTLLVTMNLYGYRRRNIKKMNFNHIWNNRRIALFILFFKNLFLYPSHPHFHSYQINMSTLTKGHFTLHQTLKSLLNSN